MKPVTYLVTLRLPNLPSSTKQRRQKQASKRTFLETDIEVKGGGRCLYAGRFQVDRQAEQSFCCPCMHGATTQQQTQHIK